MPAMFRLVESPINYIWLICTFKQSNIFFEISKFSKEWVKYPKQSNLVVGEMVKIAPAHLLLLFACIAKIEG